MRTALLVTAAAVVLSPLAAQAEPATPKDRVVSFKYFGLTGANHPRVTFDQGCLPSFTVANRPLRSCGTFETSKGEKSLNLTAQDDAGLPAGLAVKVGEDKPHVFCGTTTLPLPSKAPVKVTVRAFSTSECRLTATGTVTATLSRRPAPTTKQ